MFQPYRSLAEKKCHCFIVSPLGEKCLLIFCGTVCKQVHKNIMAFGGWLDSVFNFEKSYAAVDVSNKRAFVNIVCVVC